MRSKAFDSYIATMFLRSRNGLRAGRPPFHLQIFLGERLVRDAAGIGSVIQRSNRPRVIRRLLLRLLRADQSFVFGLVSDEVINLPRAVLGARANNCRGLTAHGASR